MNSISGYVSIRNNAHKLWYIIYQPEYLHDENNVPLFIVHGGPGMKHNYMVKHFLKLITNKNRSIVFYDQFGCGNSVPEIVNSTDKPIYSIEASVYDLHHLISTVMNKELHNNKGLENNKNIPLKNIHLIGHSFGGILVYEYICYLQQKQQNDSSVINIVSCVLLSTPSSIAKAMNETKRLKQELIPSIMSSHPHPHTQNDDANNVAGSTCEANVHKPIATSDNINDLLHEKYLSIYYFKQLSNYLDCECQRLCDGKLKDTHCNAYRNKYPLNMSSYYKLLIDYSADANIFSICSSKEYLQWRINTCSEKTQKPFCQVSPMKLCVIYGEYDFITDACVSDFKNVVYTSNMEYRNRHLGGAAHNDDESASNEVENKVPVLEDKISFMKIPNCGHICLVSSEYDDIVLENPEVNVLIYHIESFLSN